MTSPQEHDQHDLRYLSDLSPSWGQKHIYAVDQHGSPFELLDAGSNRERINELVSWSRVLDKLNHPVIPKVSWASFGESSGSVCFELKPSTSLYDLIKDGRLTRVDAIYTFYQVALALVALHERKITFGNLNLQTIFLTPSGQAELRGWVPPSSNVSFEIRRVNELKLFQYAFYRCIVGYPPPIHNERDQRSQSVSRETALRQRAWESWYQLEEERASQLSDTHAHLHRSSLFMFHAPPQSAQHLVELLYPFTDQALANLITLTSDQLLERQRYEETFQSYETLVRRLDQVRKHLADWLLSQRETFEECVDEREALEAIFDESLALVTQLEAQAKQSFVSVYDERLIKHTPHHDQPAGTESYLPAQHQLYDRDERPSPLEPEKGLSLTNRLQILNQEKVNLNSLPSESPESLFQFLLEESSREALPLNNDTRVFGRTFAQGETLANGETIDELTLGDEAFIEQELYANAEEPSLERVNSVPMYSSSPQHQREVDAPRYDTIERSAHDLELHEPLDTNLYPYGPSNTYEQAPLNKPQRPQRHTLFIAALYLSLFAFAFWYLWLASPPSPQEQPSSGYPPLKRSQPVSAALETSVEPATELSEQDSQAPASTSTKAPQSSEPLAPDELSSRVESSPKEPSTKEPSPKEPSTKLSAKLSAPPPEGMLTIPGGELLFGTTEAGYQELLRHCKFAPYFHKRANKKGLDSVEKRCAYLIKKTFLNNPLVRNEQLKSAVKPFWLDQYEVTRGAYHEACLEGKIVCPSSIDFDKESAELPITLISFDEARDYCAWRGKRLPREEEWLFAARGDSLKPYPWERGSIYQNQKSKTHRRANYQSLELSGEERDGFVGPHAATLSLPEGRSPYEVEHMNGNVREWVVSSSFRYQLTIRGPGYETPVWGATVMLREVPEKRNVRYKDVGFRCAQDIQLP